MPAAELPILLLTDAAAWSSWLIQHATSSPGVWLVMAKKNTTHPTSLSLSQALDEALCHGWINGQAKSRDVGTVMQRFTPRTAKSTWSQINKNHVARLGKEGRMQARGLGEVEKAKADGRWDAAYGAMSTIEAPGDLMAAIEEAGVRKRWEALGKGERYLLILKVVNLRTEKGRGRAAGRVVEGLLESGQVEKQEWKGKKRKAVAAGEEDDLLTPEPTVRESRAERAQRRARKSEKGSDAF